MAKPESIFTKDAFRDLPFEIGDFTYGVPQVFWWGEPVKLKIGRYCSIAKGVQIYLGGNHRTDWITTYPFSGRSLVGLFPEAANIKGHPASRGDIVIGNDVWIGSDAIILSGVRIGDGAVIGAGSVVTGDVAPYEIVGGNPARRLSLRFDDDTIDTLLAIRWWDWDEATVRQNIPLLMSADIAALRQVADRIASARDVRPRGAPQSIRKMHFEIVRGCQLRCIGCPNSTLNPKVERISVDAFAACLENLDVAEVQLLRLFNFGEPLLHHDLAGILREIPRASVRIREVEISTNAQFVKWDAFEEALATRVLTRIAVSCDGEGTAEDYERLRPPSRWSKLIEFLEKTKALTDKHHPALQLISRSVVETAQGRALWNDILRPRGWTPEYRSGMALPEAEVSLALKPQPPGRGQCEFLRSPDRLYVDFDGTVVACCAHPRAGVFGNLMRQSYSEIVSGQQRKAMAQAMIDNRKAMPVCGGCVF